VDVIEYRDSLSLSSRFVEYAIAATGDDLGLGSTMFAPLVDGRCSNLRKGLGNCFWVSRSELTMDNISTVFDESTYPGEFET
jgi:hypothetical protein